jgi:hypothetical protein
MGRNLRDKMFTVLLMWVAISSRMICKRRLRIFFPSNKRRLLRIIVIDLVRHPVGDMVVHLQMNTTPVAVLPNEDIVLGEMTIADDLRRAGMNTMVEMAMGLPAVVTVMIHMSHLLHVAMKMSIPMAMNARRVQDLRLGAMEGMMNVPDIGISSSCYDLHKVSLYSS